MRKYGKYEKQPEAVPAKQPTVKSALLQTYFISLVCLVMCVCMFFGTSYAWFTSEVENTQNEIFIGTLDVGLYKQGKGEGAAPLDLADDANKLFDDNIRWEPGYTALETIQIVNEGDLAFKYELSFTEGAVTGTAAQTLDIATIAQYFDVWVYDYYDNGNVAPDPKSYADISTDKRWDYAGTLAEVLAGKVVLSGNMNTVRDANLDPEDANEGTTDGVNTTDTYTIALHMKEETKDVALMGQKLSLTVKLVAYQKVEEADGLGSGYDQLVTSEKSLREAVQNGGRVTLINDIALTETLTVPADKTVVLDMNGHTISQTKNCTENYSMISNLGSLTITGNGKISFTDTSAGDPNFGWGTYTIRNAGTLVVENGTIEHLGNQSFSTHCIMAIFQYSGSTTINGGTISTPNYRSVRLWHGDMTINGGTFNGQIWVQAVSGEKATLTINGGSFAPVGNDKSSVYVENSVYEVAFSVTGGKFATKIGVAKPDLLPGCITGGEFTEDAKNETAAILFAASFAG